MKVQVNQETCIGCGMCVDICPEVFKFNDATYKSEAIEGEVPEEMLEKTQECIEVCPTEAIEEV